MSNLTLTILLPGELFVSITDARHIAVETNTGVMGLLPRRRDCVAALVPGILICRRDKDQITYVAVDRGIMVKVADQVTIAVRRAFTSQQLEELETIINAFYHDQEEENKELRTLFAKIESGLLRQLADYHHA